MNSILDVLSFLFDRMQDLLDFRFDFNCVVFFDGFLSAASGGIMRFD
jgi:hypothetical protein